MGKHDHQDRGQGRGQGQGGAAGVARAVLTVDQAREVTADCGRLWTRSGARWRCSLGGSVPRAPPASG
ncbi:hypothetical protein AB8O64_35485 (plasmid) [Streptomyces sp. QH1-20]|uniref:hypothetical protein n=1 Tax=Streptomyces sp. QH1-20 TaxID=3240934 RepID=UPI003514DAA3